MNFFTIISRSVLLYFCACDCTTKTYLKPSTPPPPQQFSIYFNFLSYSTHQKLFLTTFNTTATTATISQFIMLHFGDSIAFLSLKHIHHHLQHYYVIPLALCLSCDLPTNKIHLPASLFTPFRFLLVTLPPTEQSPPSLLTSVGFLLADDLTTRATYHHQKPVRSPLFFLSL